MSQPLIYVETTIPSFFFERRKEPEVVARRLWTRRWWDLASGRYELVSSTAVLEELGQSPVESRREERLSLLDGIDLLPIEPAVLEIVETYVNHRLMPADPGGDAMHLALASYHRCDFLATWNCRHLANANKFGHIRRINTMLGLLVPELVTPLELLESPDPSGD